MPRPLSFLVLIAAFALAPSLTQARWAHDPTASLNIQRAPISAHSFIYSGHDMATDGAGGFIVGFDHVFTGDDIYAQRVDPKGNVLWGPGGVPVCTAAGDQSQSVTVSDRKGGAYIAWIDPRGGTKDIYAQHLNANGVPQWTADGVQVCGAAGDQTELQAVTDILGTGLYLVWTDGRTAGNSDIYARYVNAAGVPQGAAGGIAVCAAAGNQSEPVIEDVENGGVTIAWTDPRTDAGDIYAARFTFTGFMPWTANGVGVCTATGAQIAPAICWSGAQGGAVISWTDSRAGADIYAQSVSNGGVALWAVNGVPVCVASGTQASSKLVFDQQGGAVVGWADARAGLFNIYAQRLDLYLGAPLWTVDGVPVATGLSNETVPVLDADGLGGAYFAYRDDRAGAYGDVYGQRLDANGARLWSTSGVPVGTGPGEDANASIVADGVNGCYVAFRNLTTQAYFYQVSIQRVDRWGYLGAEPWMADVSDVRNDQGGKVKVSWEASPLDTDPLFESVYDYQVFRSAPATMVARALQAGAVTFNAGETAHPSTGGIPKLLALVSGATTSYWEYVGGQPAYHLPAYSFLAPTTGDSVAGSNPLTAYMVQARDFSYRHWESEPDSGYSVDNLAPSAPTPFTGLYSNGSALMQWGSNHEPDFDHYRLYRGASPSFTPGPAALIDQPTVTSASDAPGAPYAYKLTAVDTHGNESQPTTLVPSGALAVGDPGRVALALAAPAPNPVHRGAGAIVRFGLPAAGPVELAAFDPLGREVRVLASGAWAPGEHALRFDGRDEGGRPLAPGLYFLRLKTAAGSKRVRLLLLD